MPHETPQPIYLKDYRVPDFLIDRVDLHFELEEQQTLVSSTLRLRRNPQALDQTCPLRLDGEGLDLLSLELDGKPLQMADFNLEPHRLTVYRVPARFTLHSRARMKPQENTALEGLYKSAGMFCTQCEAEGFRKITWFLDRPDVMARFSTTIEAEESRYPVLLSNGNLQSHEALPRGRHRVRWEDPFPKPCYLFALVAGDLLHIEDRYVTGSGRSIELRIYVEAENIGKCTHAMHSLKQAMAWDEQCYGREYDLDIYMIVAVNDFNMGAMENKGLNIFNSKFVLASPESATDQDFLGIEGVVAHEYFHNWTGNRITCRDWFQLSLKEGLTVFRDQEFSADMGSRAVKRIEDVRLLRAHQFAEDAGPMAHPVRPESYIEINNFYTVTVYEKGAEVVRMQQRLLGPDAYRRATDLYFDRFDGQAVTTDDFVACMEDASSRDLRQFRRWYSQAGTPELQVTDEYDAANRQYRLHVRQSCPATPGQAVKQPFHLPLAVGLLDGQGNDLPLRLQGDSQAAAATRMLELCSETESFRFEDVPCHPVPSLLRGFSAPVKVHYPYHDRQLMFLMAHDSDGFCRWDAAETLSQRILLRLIEDPGYQVPDGFVDAFRRALTDSAADKSLLAEILTLPSESYLGDQMEEVDVDAIHVARDKLMTILAETLRGDLVAVYEASRGGADYRPAAAEIGRRRLKNLCLGYLIKLDDRSSRELCLDQYQTARNMTDTLAALGLLAASSAPERVSVLENFYQRWKDDALVLDKWFTVQAVSPRADTLQRVMALTEHPAFSIINPNRVRSLVGAFCSGNPLRFHDPSGAGYRFLAQRVLELDPLNPQVAARMLRIMSRWRRYDPMRSELMRGELQRVLSTQGLSRDVFEIACKSLQAD